MAEPRAPSPVTIAARRLVAERKPRATELGRSLAELVGDPEAFVAALGADLGELADGDYLAGMRSVTPGLGPAYGVRLPLLTALHSSFRARTRRVSPSLVLYLVERLLREDAAEPRWLAVWMLGRTLPLEPERRWQLLRRVAREAGEWVTVDTLARLYATGILLDSRRWAELEQLVFSPSPWERRLVGSTLATLPFVRIAVRPDRTGERAPASGRDPEVARRGLDLVGELIGDDEPDVQKALAWALRSLTLADRAAVVRFAQEEAQKAAATGDGHRAWVVRDALPSLPEDESARLRTLLAGVRKRPGAPSTSTAAGIAAEFLANLPPSPAGQAATSRGGGATAPGRTTGRSSAA